MAIKVWLMCFTCLTCCLLSLTEGAAFFNIGECPDGHKAGDTWRWGDSCGECSCHTGHWGCVSCGVLGHAFNCYHERDMEAPYPECCPSLVCKGDPHFNQTKFDILG